MIVKQKTLGQINGPLISIGTPVILAGNALRWRQTDVTTRINKFGVTSVVNIFPLPRKRSPSRLLSICVLASFLRRPWHSFLEGGFVMLFPEYLKKTNKNSRYSLVEECSGCVNSGIMLNGRGIRLGQGLLLILNL